jgi:putative ABC transport system permease protein
MGGWRQFLALLQMSLGSSTGRLGSSFVTIVGTLCVVGVLISMLSMGAGARLEAESGASPDRAVIETNDDWIGGTISKQDAAIIASAPGIRRESDGKPMASGLSKAMITVYEKDGVSSISVPVLGVEPEYLRMISTLKMTGGRLFQPGLHELIVGKTRYSEDRGMAIGDRLWMHGDYWTIVGHFELPGTGSSLLLTDAATLMAAIGANSFYRMLVTLDPAVGFSRLAQAVASNPTLHVELRHEAEAAVADAKAVTRLLDFVSYFVGAVMAAGATVGSVNALYALVDQRRREMATLRAIGFGGGPIVLAILVESMLMALPGALLGALAAWILFNGHHISPEGLAFDLAVTPGLVAIGIGWALLMGLIGGLMPALRAASVPVTDALRSS